MSKFVRRRPCGAEPTSAGVLTDECSQVLKQLTPIENEIACTDGRTLVRRIMPYRTENHHIDGVVITVLDITNRKRREEELRQTQEKLKVAAAAAMLGWYSYDVQANDLNWSDELRAIAQVDKQAHLSIDRAIGLMVPEDRERYRAHVAEALRVCSEAGYRGEFRVQRADGSVL